MDKQISEQMTVVLNGGTCADPERGGGVGQGFWTP